MRRHKLRSWKSAAILSVAVVAVAVWATSSLAASHATEVKVAIMTDCKGAFGFGYEPDIGGAQAAFAQYAHGHPTNRAKPSAGMTNISVNGTSVKIVGYGCGSDSVPVAVTETKRLMEQLGADVMIGPLSGDEAVYVANYAKAHPTKTFVIGTAGSEDPTMQIHPANLFRYHGDGAQWNAGIGEIAYKSNGWRKAAIIMDDYSFGWTSGAGMILDFCAVGGQITKRVFPPLNTTDYAPFVRQLPPPTAVDGYFSAVGGTGTSAMLKAYSQAYGPLDPKKWIGNLFFGFLGADKTIAPQFVGAYIGGTGTGPGLKTAQAKAYEAVVKKWYGPSKINPADLFVANYYNAAWGFVQGLAKSGGAVGTALQKAMPTKLKEGYAVSRGGYAYLDSRRQAIQDQYQLQLVKNPDGSVGPTVVAYVPAVDQSFGGLVKPTDPPYGRTVPACKKLVTPWQGKIKVVKNGVITNKVYK